MNRYSQIAIWILAAPLIGAVQAVASMLPIMLQKGDLGSSDLHLLLLGLTVAYGGGWFTPALILADLLMLKRTLSRKELGHYLGKIAITALVIGFFMSGMLLMIGYPATACAILGWGFLLRKGGEKLSITAK